MKDEISAATIANDKSRIPRASEAISYLTNDLKPAVKDLEPLMRRITDEVCTLTRKAPLRELAIAFLLGGVIARRHR